MQCSRAVLLVHTFGRTKRERHQHTKIILMLVFHLPSSLWMKVKGEEEEYMSGFMHQQPIPEVGKSVDLWIPSVLQYFKKHLMPPARMHLILTNL